jgi:hypothetical protein
MLLNTERINKKRERIYINTLTGREETIPYVGYHCTKHSIPDYAFGCMAKMKFI